MSTLDRALRKKLSDTIIIARQVAEEAAKDAVRRLGIIEDEAPAYLAPDQKALRVRLRAHARTLGDEWNAEKKKLLTTKQLENEAAYEIWHRMLFGRFRTRATDPSGPWRTHSCVRVGGPRAGSR
jgi:hypothetical protein